MGEEHKTEPAPPEEATVRAAYDAWSDALGGMVPAGLAVPYRLPKFDELSSHVRSAWDAAVTAIEPVMFPEPEVTAELEPAAAPVAVATTSEK